MHELLSKDTAKMKMLNGLKYIFSDLNLICSESVLTQSKTFQSCIHTAKAVFTFWNLSHYNCTLILKSSYPSTYFTSQRRKSSLSLKSVSSLPFPCPTHGSFWDGLGLPALSSTRSSVVVTMPVH